jgi:hypothetical protein
VPTVLKPGNLKLLEPSKPVQSCTEIDLLSPQQQLLLVVVVVVSVVVFFVVAVTVKEVRLMEVFILPA